MQTQVRNWGNSQGIRIPKDILLAANIKVDDVLDITASNGTIILSRPFHHKTLEERAYEYNGNLGLDGEYDWGEPVGRERWQ